MPSFIDPREFNILGRIMGGLVGLAGAPARWGGDKPSLPIHGSKSPDTPYPAIRAMYGEPAPSSALEPMSAPNPAPRQVSKPVSKPAARPPAKQGTKAPASAAQQKLATANPIATPVQEDPFTQAQRMVNGTEQIPASAVAPVSDPVEDRYQLLLKMYGITPDNTAAPNGMPDTMARQAGLNTGATSGVFNPEAALQYYGGDQAVYDALARMYGW